MALCLLAACSTPPPAPPPQGGVAVPAGWSQPLPGPLAEGDAPWWQGFGDATLARLVRQAQGANTDVGVAQANLRQARALREGAAAALWPSLDFTASAQRASGAGQAGSSLFHPGIDAGWDPDLSGAARNAVAVREAQAAASAATLAAVRVAVAADLALAYLQLRGAQARMAVARENLQAQQDTLQLALWREQAGLASSVESAQARVAVEQTRAQLPQLDSSADQSLHAVAVLAGLAPAALAPTLGVAAPLPLPPERMAVAIPAEVLRRRPDLLAAELQLRAAAGQVAQAQAQGLPQLQLSASLAWSATTLDALGSVSAARSLLAAARQMLFDAGGRRAAVAAQQAAFEAAGETYRARVLAALQEVEDALSARDAARRRLAALGAAAQAAGDAALLARQRYASGLIDFLTVLDTQRTQLALQDSLAAAQADWALVHVRLYRALGGGWPAAEAAS